MLLGIIGIGVWGIAACEYPAIPPVVPSPSLPAQGGVWTPEPGKSPTPPPSPTREVLAVFPGFGLEQVIGKGSLREIVWSSRGSPLIVGTTVSLEGIAPQTGAVIWRQTLPARLKALAISLDGHWLAALVGGDLWLWAHPEEDLQRIRVLPRAIDPGFESPTLAFSPDGRQLAWITSKSGVRRIRLPEGEELEPIPSYGAGWLAFAPDGKTLILAGPTRGGMASDPGRLPDSPDRMASPARRDRPDLRPFLGWRVARGWDRQGGVSLFRGRGIAWAAACHQRSRSHPPSDLLAGQPVAGRGHRRGNRAGLGAGWDAFPPPMAK